MDGKSNHRVNVIRIREILPHPNADRLCIIPIPDTDYQYVGKIGEMNVGDLVAYIQPDSVVPDTTQFSWLWGPRTFDGPVPEKYRRITARRFRKEWSEGLLISLTPPSNAEPSPSDSFFNNPDGVYVTCADGTRRLCLEGDDVGEALGVTHYEPPEDDVSTRGDNERGPQYNKFPRSLRGWFYYVMRLIGFDLNGPVGGANEKSPEGARPVYDVEAFKNYKNAFVDGEPVIVTEKIHGSNARFTFEDGLLGGKMYAGSRKLWKAAKSKCVWREALEQNPWIEQWCRAHPGWTLYGEVAPTQKGYRYGCADGQVKLFLFDVLKPDGEWAALEEIHVDIFGYWAPILYWGPFELTPIKLLATGASTVVGADHKREGVVVRPRQERHVRGLGRLQLKIVSNEFLEAQTREKDDLPKAA